MRQKRVCALMLAAVVAAGVFTGCGDKKEDASTGIATNDGTETGGEAGASGDVVELTFYNADGEEDPWSDPVAEKLTEATGVKLKTDYPVSSDDQKVALMIAEQSYPDLIYAKGDAGSLIEAGALMDMTDLIEEYGPNIKKLYGDEFETMLKDYMAENPTTDDGHSTIGLTLSASDWHWMITLGNPAGYIADGAPDNGQWLIDENNQAMYKFRSDKEREYFKWLNKLYNEGILDPEFATQTHEDYIAKIASGRVLSLFDTDWDYSDGEKVLKADGKFGKTYAPLPFTMDKETKCVSLMYQGLTTGQGVGISVDCKDPVAAIKYLDYICSDEGQVLVQWGIEGVNYQVDENGKRYRTQEEIDASNNDKDYSKKTGVGFHNYPFPYYGDGIVDETGSTYTTKSRESVVAEYDEEQKAACEKWGVELLTDIFPQAKEFEVPAYSPIWAYAKPSEFDEIGNQLDEIAWSSLISCIIGSESDFDASYDKMLEELEGVGMSDAEKILTDIVQERVSIAE